MEIENKLDEDFIFYLGFVNTFLKHVRDAATKHKCEQWLKKLCGEVYEGVEEKRSRNIYLSQLLICMQSGELKKEFLLPPVEVDLANAEEVFQLGASCEIETPEWLEDSNVIPTPVNKLKKGRTYLATRTLPDGQGAFAYVAVSLEDDEPMWLGGGECAFDKDTGKQYKDQVSNSEIEKILARRKDPKDREKVITFYNVLLQNIADELQGAITSCQNDTINGLVEQLSNDLKDRDQFGPLEGLNKHEQRTKLLLILQDRIQARVDKVAKREEFLDEIEYNVMSRSVFETSTTDVDKYQLSAAMWEQAINKAPNKKNMDKLKANYPLDLIEMYLKLLANHKQEIAIKMQRRYENIISQMKKELQKEDEKGKKLVDFAQNEYDHILEILEAVKAAYKKKLEAENKNKEKSGSDVSDHSKFYDQMRTALCDTQKWVEEEAARGKALAAEINAVNEQIEYNININEETVRRSEEANMATMRNIQRLQGAIQQHQNTIDQIRSNAAGKSSDQFTDFC